MTGQSTASAGEAPSLVVGMGASAGGIQALRALLASLPSGAPVAYLLVQHTDPARVDSLAAMLAGAGPLPVEVARDGDPLLRGRVYLVPPDRDCEIAEDGRLRLLPARHAPGPRHSIDHALTSIAERFEEAGVGVILSGSGADGLQGMRAIKAAGGLTLVQEPASAEFRDMPEAVIGANLADLILQPAEIGPEIGRILEWDRPAADAAEGPEPLEPILRLIQRKTGHDFRQYKEGTLRRRIARRMLVNRCPGLDDYRRLLLRSDGEADALVQDLLISVTGFFRDSGTFDALRRTLRPRLEDRDAGEVFRVWVPGCATGEEAYSIAIVLAELLGDRLDRLKLQIFATDIDARAIAEARRATYTADSVRDVPGPLLRRYFDNWDNIYRLRRDLRDMVIFAEHDLARDPPFTNLDLVSCRNVLIYFRRPLQEQLLANFHHALRQDGLLMLGNSESADGSPGLFTRVDEQARIYRRVDAEIRPPVHLYRPQVHTVIRREAPQARAQTAEERLRRILADGYVPPCVLVNSRQEIVYVRGDVSRYVRLPQGEINANLLEMAASPEIRVELRLVLARALREGRRVVSHPVPVPGADPARRVGIVGVPGDDGYLAVVFEEETAAPREAAPKETESAGAARRIAELERELAATREHLNANIEELEAANEELQSTNEEFQSTTEELQSTVEEYQTTNEELQSTNEELNTVNDELSAKTEALEVANADLQGILDNVATAIVVLDEHLRVSRYSSTSGEILGLEPGTVGRPFIGLGGDLDPDRLSGDIHRAARTREPVTSETTLDERFFRVRVIPRVAPAGQLSGLIIVFTDETERAEADKRANLLATVIRDANDAVVVRDMDGVILAWNAGATRMFGYGEDEMLGRPVSVLAPDELGGPSPAGGEPVFEETRWWAKDGRAVEVAVTTSLLKDDRGRPYAIAAIAHDIGASKRAERKLAALVESAPDPMLLIDERGGITLANRQAEGLFGYPREELVGLNVDRLVPARLRPGHAEHRARYLEAPEVRPMSQRDELVCVTRDGEEVPVEVNLGPVEADDGVQIMATIRNVTERRRVQRELREARETAETANLTKSRFLAAASHDLRQPLQSLSLYLRALSNGDLGRDQRQEILDKMSLPLKTMRHLLNALLDLSKLDTGEVRPEMRVVAVQEVIDSLCDRARAEAEDKAVELRCVRCTGFVHTDPTLLEDVLGNLLFNAIRYTPSGRVLVGCRGRGDKLRVDVIDTGPGIPAANREEIFEEFVRLPKARETERAGLGLGLSIVRRLVDLLGHSLDMVSEEGRGTRFSVLIPRAERPPDDGAEPPLPEASQDAPVDGRILLVDDDEAVRDSTRMFLNMEGVQVTATADGGEGMRLAEAEPPDVVIVDYGLGNENGLDLVRRLRESLESPELPAILVTGESRARIEEEAAEAGIRLLLKPVDTDELVRLVRSLLASQPASGD